MDQKESKVFFYPSRLKDPQRYPPSPSPVCFIIHPLFIGRSSGSPPPPPRSRFQDVKGRLLA